MPTLAQTGATLADLAKRLDPDGNIDTIIEILNEDNRMLDDCLWVEANQRTAHRSTIRTGLPKGTWRLLNRGVPNEKSTTAQITHSIGMLETYSEVDKDLIEINGNTAQYRMSEDKAFIEGLGQTMQATLLYGNVDIRPEQFTGLAPHYSDLNADNSLNIIDAGGTEADLTSMYMVSWGDQTVMGLYPNGSRAGLTNEDLGRETLFDDNGNKYEGYRTHYQWKAGLAVRDWRYAGRVANIDVSDIGTPANAKNLVEHMIRLSERVKRAGTGRTAFYVSRWVRENLRLGILEKIANNLTWETVEGQRVMVFDDVPVHRVDQILDSEARVI